MCLQLAGEAEQMEDIALWICGMVLIGVGWNCGFSASTVRLTQSYVHRPEHKAVIQAANDGLTFLIVGAIISCTSVINQAGGGGLDGWRTVNWVVLGFIGFLSFVLGLDVVLERRETANPASS